MSKIAEMKNTFEDEEEKVEEAEKEGEEEKKDDEKKEGEENKDSTVKKEEDNDPVINCIN